MHFLVFIEQRNGTIKKASLETLSAAAVLAKEPASPVEAVCLGTASGLDTLGAYGASKVYHVPDSRLDLYSSTAAVKAVTAVATEYGADVVFLPATSLGRDLAPLLAVRLDAGYAADVVSLALDEGGITAVRPVFAGKAFERVRIETPRQVYTLRPNVFPALTADNMSCPVVTFDAALSEEDFTARSVGTSIAASKLDVAEATIIVSGGRGMQGPEHWHYIEDLAGVLGAATGASRAAVDAGWRPHAEQVGQTGKTVSPNLYIACGISGAIQHLAGMSSAKVIVAINKDKDAPIFQAADYGIVGDVFEVLPALTDALKRHMGS
ncbi:MAG: electron transfer flavoprotein subunit alpha/FixB family protein [Bacteroidota bacterium]|nr:electron transfer flavoprotein subunit alpha/FixB family protein [Bacteroidota bacterium]